MDITVLVVGPDRVPVANPLHNWEELTVDLLHNEVGAGEMVLPASDPTMIAALRTPGNGITVIRDGAEFAGGPIEVPVGYDWSAEDTTGMARVNFATHEVHLARRLCYPNPTAASTAQTAVAWSATANAEVIMRDLVRLNAGPDALLVRRTPDLVLGPLAGVGSSVTISTRFDPLTDVLREVAAAGGNLAFEIRPVAGQLQFIVRAPIDRSASVRFSPSLGTLRTLSTSPAAPTATVAIVGGEGTGTDRAIVERAGPQDYGRIEAWVAKSGTQATTAELQQQGDAFLLEAGEKLGLQAEAIDGPYSRYGDYLLGDLVGVEFLPGYHVAQRVTAVRLSATQDGDTIQPTIGTDERRETALARQVRDVQRRLGRQERN